MVTKQTRSTATAQQSFACLLAALALAGPATAFAQTTTRTNLSDELRGLVDSAIAQDGCVGLSVAVMHGDEWLLADGFGVAELEHGVKADRDTMFRIGSVTKQFTAAAVMRLRDEGDLELDDGFCDFLTDYPYPGVDISIRHLLTHTSGIPSYTNLEEWPPLIPLELTHERLLGLFQDRDLEFEPGTDYEYNNSAYYLLGVLLEEISGETYADHLQNEFFTPLKLTRTRYGSNQDLIPNRAQGYQLIDGKLANDQPIGMSQPGAAGALLSTGYDLVRWARALDGGQVVDDAAYQEMITPYVLADGTDRDYGFGLTIRDADGHRVISHGGGIPGFNSVLSHYPDQELTVAVISNSEGYSAGRLGQQLAARVLAADVEPAVKSIALRDPSAVGKLPLTQQLPHGWNDEPTSSSMRLAQYRIAPESDTQCVVYWFGEGGGGGKQANLDRWKSQFAPGAKVNSQEIEVAADVQASILDVAGTYVAEVRPGSGQRLNESGWTMLAAYVDAPGGPLYIKLVGKTGEVGAQREAFDAWIRSFRSER